MQHLPETRRARHPYVSHLGQGWGLCLSGRPDGP